jgi:hypothetical protein
MRTGSEGLSTRGRVMPEATGRWVAVFSRASMDIFLRKAEAGAMMSAMITGSPENSAPEHRRFAPRIFARRLHPAEGEIFCLNRP